MIDATRTTVEDAIGALANFLRRHSVEALNLAGPRATEWPDGYAYASEVLEMFVSKSGM